MPVRYQQLPEDLPLQQSAFVDDDSSWWAGVQTSFSTVAIAAVLAVTSLSTAIAANLPLVDDGNDAFQNATIVDEDYSPSLAPVSSYLQSVNRQCFLEADEIPAGNLYGQPDEDYWINPVLPVQATLLWPQQYSFDVQELSGRIDEDYWVNPVFPAQASLRWPQQYSFDVQELGVQPRFDEDYWQRRLSSPFGNFVPALQDGGTSSNTVSTVTYLDEDYWQRFLNIPIGNSAPTIQSGGTSGYTNPQVLTPDEDFWKNPVLPVQAINRVPQPFLYDQQETARLFGQFGNEDFWINPVAPVPATLIWPQPYLYDVQEPSGSLHGPLEDEPWFSHVAPTSLQMVWPQQFLFDNQEPGSLIGSYGNEDQWINPVAPVSATLRWPLPFLYDVQETTVGFSVQPEEFYWQNPVPPVQASLIWPKPWIYDSQDPASNFFGLPVEDYWINPVSPEQLKLYQPLPYDHEQEDIAIFYPVPPAPGIIIVGPVIRDFWATIANPSVISTISNNVQFFQSLNSPVPQVIPAIHQQPPFQPVATGINPVLATADGFGNLGTFQLPKSLLVAPGNGRLSRNIYFVVAAGTVSSPGGNSYPTVNLILNQNYFTADSYGQITARADTIATLSTPFQLHATQTCNWSLVCMLTGKGPGSGILIGTYTFTVNGIVTHGKLASSFNPVVEPTLQFSLGVQFTGAANGTPFEATLTQFQLQNYLGGRR